MDLPPTVLGTKNPKTAHLLLRQVLWRRSEGQVDADEFREWVTSNYAEVMCDESVRKEPYKRQVWVDALMELAAEARTFGFMGPDQYVGTDADGVWAVMEHSGD